MQYIVEDSEVHQQPNNVHGECHDDKFVCANVQCNAQGLNDRGSIVLERPGCILRDGFVGSFLEMILKEKEKMHFGF